MSHDCSSIYYYYYYYETFDQFLFYFKLFLLFIERVMIYEQWTSLHDIHLFDLHTQIWRVVSFYYCVKQTYLTFYWSMLVSLSSTQPLSNFTWRSTPRLHRSSLSSLTFTSNPFTHYFVCWNESHIYKLLIL